jgi:uncharacterized DUF497 family protein
VSSEFDYDFEWDAGKAEANAAKHGVAFDRAAMVFRDPLALTVFDAAHSESEERWFTLGQDAAGKLLAVAHTFEATAPNRARVRLISAREATNRERRFYEDEPR